MSPFLILLIVFIYFVSILVISWITGRDSRNAAFFTGNRQSPWFIVSFGMIGATLSGLTFISIPGWVGASGFSYMQMVAGYLVGYYIIANVLLPVYYRLNLTSIYTYLQGRFGKRSHKTGSLFFILSRLTGTSFRVYLMAGVLQITVFDSWNFPFYATVLFTILLIWLYTFRGGIKTIIWTDILQTLFMLIAVGATIYAVAFELQLSFTDIFKRVWSSEYSQILFTDDLNDSRHFAKQFISGIFIAIVMTGLDQDMMQKNLSCRNLKEAKKNMYWLSFSLVPVKFMLLLLGALLLIFASETGIDLPSRADDIFPIIATQGYLPAYIVVFFIVGLVAATYSSADSTLTALTTAFTIDIIGTEGKDEKSVFVTRNIVHAGMAILLGLMILLLRLLNNDSIISTLFTVAGYTYGPLLGLFSFGLFTRRVIDDRFVPYIAILSPGLTFIIDNWSELLFNGYRFGYELIVINGLITFLGLMLISLKTNYKQMK